MPLCLAIAAPVSSRCPRKPASAAFSSATDCTCRFGTTSTWTGAWGLISSNATARSSSWTILEGVFFSAILQKMQSLICASPVGPDPLAAGPLFFSLCAPVSGGWSSVRPSLFFPCRFDAPGRLVPWCAPPLSRCVAGEGLVSRTSAPAPDRSPGAVGLPVGLQASKEAGLLPRVAGGADRLGLDQNGVLVAVHKQILQDQSMPGGLPFLPEPVP